MKRDDIIISNLQFAENEKNLANQELPKQILFGACTILGLLATLDGKSENSLTTWIYTSLALGVLSSATALVCASRLAALRYKYAVKVAAKTVQGKGGKWLQLCVGLMRFFYRVSVAVAFLSFVFGVVLLAARQLHITTCHCCCLLCF
jgi:hypothetical protein